MADQDPRAPHPSQISKTLPSTSVFITGHNASNKAQVAVTRPNQWVGFDDEHMGMAPCYTNVFHPDLNADADLKSNNELLTSGQVGLVRSGGTVCRQVDFSPGYTCTMHRTASLDYGIVIEGAIEMLLDDGSVTLMRRGDVAIQRATVHAWRNPSPTEWTRMFFVLQEIAPLSVGGEVVGEEMVTRPTDSGGRGML